MLCCYISMERKSNLIAQQSKNLIETLRSRFMKHMNRHQNIEWLKVLEKLEADHKKLESLYKMESSGGEPDVVGHDKETNEYVFIDCSPESPKGRRSLCYDRQALDSRKENKPAGSAVEMAASMGLDLLNEEQYRKLQELGIFDSKTSSWLITPPEIRKLGGAIFGDFRYGHTFIYHNGASSYYAARGFRGLLKV